MDRTPENLAALQTGFNTAFRGQFEAVEMKRDRIATTIPSTTASNTYGWSQMMTGMREWLGPRHIDSFGQSSYQLFNRSYEKTVGVDRDHVDDDNLGQYTGIFSEMGQIAAEAPEQLVWDTLAGGFTADCFDGQPYFDTDHPVIDADGETVSTFSNFQGGSGTAWYLLYTKRYMKPIIFQERRKADNLVAMNRPDDPHVFMNKEYLYGVDGRWTAGYSFPQLAYASKEPLTADNYEAARAAMASFKGDGGRPLGIVPNILVFPPSLEGKAREVIKAERDAAGATNVWMDTAELLMAERLAA